MTFPVTTCPRSSPFSTRVGLESRSWVFHSGVPPSVSWAHMAKLGSGHSPPTPPHLPTTLTPAATSGATIVGDHSLRSVNSPQGDSQNSGHAVLRTGVLLQRALSRTS